MRKSSKRTSRTPGDDPGTLPDTAGDIPLAPDMGGKHDDGEGEQTKTKEKAKKFRADKKKLLEYTTQLPTLTDKISSNSNRPCWTCNTMLTGMNTSSISSGRGTPTGMAGRRQMRNTPKHGV